MRTHHVLGPGCRAGDLVDIESRGVGGEQRARFRRAVEIGEDAFFEPHFLEHRFDHDIGAPDCVDPDGAGDQAHAAVHLVGGEPAARHGGAVIGGDPVEAFPQQIVAGLDQGDRDAGIGKAHGDAAAHRAGADHGARGDRPRLCVRRHVRHLGRLALGEEDVALRL